MRKFASMAEKRRFDRFEKIKDITRKNDLGICTCDKLPPLCKVCQDSKDKIIESLKYN